MRGKIQFFATVAKDARSLFGSPGDEAPLASTSL
jgi:hypothetical protein